jgi:hypothetical protein
MSYDQAQPPSSPPYCTCNKKCGWVSIGVDAGGTCVDLPARVRVLAAAPVVVCIDVVRVARAVHVVRAVRVIRVV